MLGLPPSTDIRKQIPKDEFFKERKIKGRERERFDSQIHSMTIRSIVSSGSVNIDEGKEISAIYVLELQLNMQDCADANLMLLDKMKHKMIYVLEYENISRIAVVEDVVFQTEWTTEAGYSLKLEGLNLDEVWANIVRGLGDLPRDVPLRDAIAEVRRVRSIDSQIAELEKKFLRTKQNHERRSLYTEIQRLKKERDTKPEPAKPEPREDSSAD